MNTLRVLSSRETPFLVAHAVSAEPRPYQSALRDEQARATRRRIVGAAAELFTERGYGPTTIDAVAERAGVGRKTVFTSVGGKATMLKLAFDWALAGDDEPVAIADRPEVRQMMEGADAEVLLDAWIAMNADIARRARPAPPRPRRGIGW
jgi:AcrR family transcriptional regulator